MPPLKVLLLILSPSVLAKHALRRLSSSQRRAHKVSAPRVSGLVSDAAIAADAIRACEAHDTSHAT